MSPFCRCFIESLDNNSSSYDLGNSSILSSYIPLNKDGDLDSCLKYVYADTNETATCNGNYVFDTSYYKSSRVIEVKAELMRVSIYFCLNRFFIRKCTCSGDSSVEKGGSEPCFNPSTCLAS